MNFFEYTKQPGYGHMNTSTNTAVFFGDPAQLLWFLVINIWVLIIVVLLAAISLYGLLGARWSLIKDGLQYGKLKEHDFGMDVPKRWFAHFYYAGFVWQLLLFSIAIGLCWSPDKWSTKGVWGPTIHSFTSSWSNKPDAHHDCALLIQQSTMLLLCEILYTMHVFRRLVECIYIHKFSNARMHIGHYLFGLAFYFMLPITILASDSSIVKAMVNPESAVHCSIRSYPRKLSGWHAVVLIVFGLASYCQHTSHKVLAGLRGGANPTKRSVLQYSMPSGGYFDACSCPHYAAEICIYLSLALGMGPRCVSLWMACMATVVNLSFTAVQTHRWYKKTFNDYPKNRAALVPGLF
jgi:3-oxo-5-alpha-steroid 4-dehydrogenase 3